MKFLLYAEVLLRFAEHLIAGALVSVTDHDIRVRRLPVARHQKVTIQPGTV